MSRKLYALFILIGAIGAIILTYIYFFVYYTATLSINANIPGYTVELFSKSTAQKWSHECPQQECIIAEVSPFEYNISISKQDYKTIIIPVKIAPRKRQNFVIEFEPDTDLKLLEKLELEETAKQKIQRLREQSKYFETFRLDEATQIIFDQDQNGLEMKLQTGESIKTISRFPLVATDMIRVEYIGESWEEIFLKIAESYYIFNTKK